jgi:hypothetical protein
LSFSISRPFGFELALAVVLVASVLPAQASPQLTRVILFHADRYEPIDDSSGSPLNDEKAGQQQPQAASLPVELAGNLGRNALRGFGASQTDFSIRRQVAITEKVKLSISAQVFSALNQPNFANPSPNEGASLGSPNFGRASGMLNQTGFGANSLYQNGGSRSMELTARIQS